jgi:DNA primase
MQIADLIAKDFEISQHGKYMKGVDHDSLVIDTEKNLFYWNSRGISGDAFVWLTKIKGMSEKDAKEFLRLNDRDTLYTFINNIQNKVESVVYPKLVDAFYEEGVHSPRDYWNSRGITNTTISRFKLGYHDGWSMIPVFMDGLFRNFQMRRDEPKKTIRPYYKGVGRLLFNSDICRIVDTVFITEGPTDCLRLVQEGVPVVSHTGGAGNWDEKWSKYFFTQKQIYYIGDNDVAGRAGALKVAKSLGQDKTKIFTFEGFDEKYDIVDFFRDGGKVDDLMNLIKTESKLCFFFPEWNNK